MTIRKSGRPSTKVFAVAAIVVALLLAGVVSYYAAGSPDGLERVAHDSGLPGEQRDGQAVDTPFADYSAESVEDARLSRAIAGVAGVAVVLVLAGALGYAVRRRTPSPRGPASDGEDEDRTARVAAEARPGTARS